MQNVQRGAEQADVSMLLRRGGKKGEGDMSYQLIMPKQIFYGEGALEQAAPARL